MTFRYVKTKQKKNTCLGKTKALQFLSAYTGHLLSHWGLEKTWTETCAKTERLGQWVTGNSQLL